MSLPSLLRKDEPGCLIQGDCIEVMRTIESNSIDCVFADPPYNLQLAGDLHRPDDSRVDGVTQDWDKFDSFRTYDEFTRAWLAEAKRVLHKDGTIWVMGSYHNIFRVGAILQDLGFWILNDVVWCKSNPMPNFRGTRFTNAHETLIWASKSEKSSYCFNYQTMKAENEGRQMRSDWKFPICSGKERLKGEDDKKLHPTQKPEALLHRVLTSSTKPGNIVLDPFCGTGTTAAMAKRLGRKFITIERDIDYYKGAKARVEAEVTLPMEEIEIVAEKKSQPRVPFNTFVDSGKIPVGTRLYDRTRRIFAVVNEDGTLEVGEQKGSIHQIGAYVTSAPSCNGWTFWHFEKKGKLQPLDDIREEYRRKQLEA